MKLFMLFVTLAALGLPSIGVGANRNPPLTVTVKFDKSFYDLEFGREVFKYSESGRAYSIKIKGCNRSKVTQIEKTYRSLLKKYSSHSPRQITEYDIEVSSNGKKTEVARGSEFGNWLRNMPKKIMYIDAEARTLCKE